MIDANQATAEAPPISLLDGWRGFWVGVLTAVLTEYAYGAAVMIAFMSSPRLLHFWNFGGVWEKAAFAVPIWILIATVAIWTYRRAKFFAGGLITFLAVVTTGFAVYILFFVPGFGF
jgi:hypothetical protein